MTNPSQFVRVKLNKPLVGTREPGEPTERENVSIELTALATASGIARLLAIGFEVSLEPAAASAPAELHAEG